MKILVLCDRPNPPGYIPRIRYWCDYLAGMGYEITLVTEQSEVKKYLSDKIRVFTFDYLVSRNKIAFYIEWLTKTLLNLLYDHKGRFLLRKISKIPDFNDFDAVICSSTFHSFPLTTAAMVAEKKKIPLYADLRDIIEQTPASNNSIFIHRLPSFIGRYITKHYKHTHICRRNTAIRKAKAVTTVSQWHKNFLLRYNSNTYVIYNGYDERLFAPIEIRQKSFDISYFGELSDTNLRYPNILFTALKKIILRNYIDLETIRVRWFTDRRSQETIERLAKSFEIERLMEYNEFVEGDDLVYNMNSSSILLIFTNKPDIIGYRGIMTTKFFEYLGTTRPILISPDNADELSETAKNISCGLVSSDVGEIETFIADKYMEWQNNKHTASCIEYDKVKPFSRRYGTEALRHIIDNQQPNRY
jgi:hypothetical protein